MATSYHVSFLIQAEPHEEEYQQLTQPCYYIIAMSFSPLPSPSVRLFSNSKQTCRAAPTTESRPRATARDLYILVKRQQQSRLWIMRDCFSQVFFSVNQGHNFWGHATVTKHFHEDWENAVEHRTKKGTTCATCRSSSSDFLEAVSRSQSICSVSCFRLSVI